MPCVLLPASAAAFAPRSAPNVVLNKKAEAWLTQTLKRVKQDKRPLNNANQHTRCLTEILGGPEAFWTLCSIMVTKAPDAKLCKDDDPLVQACSNYMLIHVDAYVVHVDMVHSNEVAFKLTDDTIAQLIEYHKDIWMIDEAARIYDWTEKDVQIKKHNENFVQAINKFTWRTTATALEGMEGGGAGELLNGKASEAKTAIWNLFLPLMPPPQQIENLYNPSLVMPLPSMLNAMFGQSYNNAWQPSPSQPIPVEGWKVLPSSPSTVSSNHSYDSATWGGYNMTQNYGLPSPTPSFSQPMYSEPLCTTSMDAWYDEFAPIESIDMMDPDWSIPFPMQNMMIQPCGLQDSYLGFEWDKYQDFGMTM